MPKRQSDRDSTERLEKKILKYQKRLKKRKEIESEIRCPEKEQREISPQVDIGK